MARTHADALRSLKAIYIDAGKRDEWYLDLGTEAFRSELEAIGVSDVFFELFDATHMAIEYRYPLGVKYLAERLAPVSGGARRADRPGRAPRAPCSRRWGARR